ncbi:MAG: prolipoprotein diacylglyceryl transferase [Flavobacteriales bacterium]
MNDFLYINWDPNPGINLFGLYTLRYYSLMWALAFIVGFYLMKNIYKNEGVSATHMDSLFVYTIIGTFLGARLGHVFFYDWAYYKNHWLEIFLPIVESPKDSVIFGLIPGYKFIGFQGLASHGATLGILAALYLYSRRVIEKPMLWVVDRIAIPVAMGGAFVRVGNFINSEIVGNPSDLPWAVRFEQQSSGYGPILPRHPAQLYEAAGYLILFFIMRHLYWKTDKRKQPGFLFGWFFISLWTLRFVIEFVKAPQEMSRANWVLDTGQWLSMPFIAIGIFFVLRSHRNRKPSKSQTLQK